MTKQGILVLLLAVCMVGQATAWFDGGHMAVAAMTADTLSDTAFGWLQQIYQTGERCDGGECTSPDLQKEFIHDSTYMDFVKDREDIEKEKLPMSSEWPGLFPVFKKQFRDNKQLSSAMHMWHFLDFPYDDMHYESKPNMRKLESVQDSLTYRLVEFVGHMKTQARNFLTTYDADKAKMYARGFRDAYKIVSHLVGDLGQPLHTTSRRCGHHSDRGGNFQYFFEDNKEEHDLVPEEYHMTKEGLRNSPRTNIQLRNFFTHAGSCSMCEAETSPLSSLHLMWDSGFGAAPYFARVTTPEGRSMNDHKKVMDTIRFVRKAYAERSAPSCGSVTSSELIERAIVRGHRRAMFASDGLVGFRNRRTKACFPDANPHGMSRRPKTEDDLATYRGVARQYSFEGMTESAELLTCILEETFQDASDHRETAAKAEEARIRDQAMQAALREKMEKEEAARREAERIAAEEQRRAEEEQRRAEEEQRRAEEEQRRAEEEQRRLEKEKIDAENERLQKEREEMEARLAAEEAARQDAKGIPDAPPLNVAAGDQDGLLSRSDSMSTILDDDEEDGEVPIENASIPSPPSDDAAAPRLPDDRPPAPEDETSLYSPFGSVYSSPGSNGEDEDDSFEPSSDGSFSDSGGIESEPLVQKRRSTGNIRGAATSVDVGVGGVQMPIAASEPERIKPMALHTPTKPTMGPV